MSHGSKKWIVDYSGRIKRSNNRTKIDYLGDLRHWEPDDDRHRRGPKEFCPQCKHVRKYIIDNESVYREARERVYAEWIEKYGLKEGDTFRVVSRLTFSQYEHFYKYFKQHPEFSGECWTYHWRSYLCWKCERKADIKDNSWRHSHGMKAHYQSTIRGNYKKYRAEVKRCMENERYDDILPYRKEWWD